MEPLKQKSGAADTNPAPELDQELFQSFGYNRLVAVAREFQGCITDTEFEARLREIDGVQLETEVSHLRAGLRVSEQGLANLTEVFGGICHIEKPVAYRIEGSR